jgi:hypothetical protein
MNEGPARVDTDLRHAPVVAHSGARISTTYRLVPSRQDPELGVDDPSTTWPVVILLLMLVPPLGWLQLSERHDLDIRLRRAVALVCFAILVTVWEGVLQMHPLLWPFLS